MSLSASEILIRRGLQAPFPGWMLVVAAGRHAERFLHSQLTSDVKGLAPGVSQQTALLDRAGRLRAFGFLRRRDDRFELLLPEEVAAETVTRLDEHVVSEDVSFELRETAILRLALGAEAVRLGSEDDDLFPLEIYGSRGFVTWSDDELELPNFEEGELEARRVLSGLPNWGDEVDTGTLVHETTLIDSAVSTDKGCFLGQETVAKVLSGRGAARAPMLLRMTAGDADGGHLIGERFSTEFGEKSGKVLSATRWEGSLFLQASVVRELRVEDREVQCRFSNGTVVEARILALPFLAAPRPEEWARQLELLAVESFAADNEDEAVELYRRAVAVCPSYADAYEGLGVILGRHGRYEEAIELMKTLLEVDRASVMAHTNLSLYYNQLGRIEDAEREAAEAMRAKIRKEQSEQELAEDRHRQAQSVDTDRERRAEMFHQVLELDPEDALGNFGLGELLVEEGRFEEAVLHLERALAADPRYSAALLALGRAYEGCDHLESARDTYRRGIDIAAARGDLATANKMQERLAVLDSRAATD